MPCIDNTDYLFENCRNVKKTVRWTVFSSAAATALRGPTGTKRYVTHSKEKQHFQNGSAVVIICTDYLFENCGARRAALRPYFTKPKLDFA